MTIEQLYELARQVWDRGRGRYDWRNLDADDAVQAAVIQCWRAKAHDPAKGIPERAYYRWVAAHAITQLASRRAYRRCGTARVRPDHRRTDDPESVVSAAILGEELRELREAMAELSPRTQRAVLAIFDGDTMQAVGASLGCSREAVRQRRNCGLRKLTRRMGAATIQP